MGLGRAVADTFNQIDDIGEGEMKSINPYNNEELATYVPYSATEVAKIIEVVQQDWEAWRDTSIEERAVLLNRVSEVLLDGRDTYATLISKEMGKLIKESRAEVEKCALVCRYYAENAAGILADQLVKTDYSKSLIAYQPIGIILAIMPWNFPFWQVIRFAAPCLMAGNSGLLKHASNTQGCGLKIEEIFQQAGLPKHVFRTLVIPSSQVSAVIDDPRIKGVTLTGSEPAGRQVAAQAGKLLKKSVLELGGSDPFVVLEDADIEKAAEMSVLARTLNVGQVCIAAKRFIVMEKVADEFERLHGERMAALVMGDPLDETTQLGPMARPELVDDIHLQVERSVASGARLVTGGYKPDRPGCFYAPTVLADVKPGMAAYDEETFGPVSALITVKDEAEAIRVANDTPFGLGASVWTNDLNRGERVARQIEAGMVFVNTVTASSPKLPFGGVKRSGYGRECADWGLKEFLNVKTICIR
jgi:succinate-semialdehyde dehydrogenase / glutarate-semialdehyde dehydrogenase